MDPAALAGLEEMALEGNKWTTKELILYQPDLPPIDISSCFLLTPTTPKDATGDGAIIFCQPVTYPWTSFFRLTYEGPEAVAELIKTVQKMCKQAGFSINCDKSDLKDKIPKIYFYCSQREVVKDAHHSACQQAVFWTHDVTSRCKARDYQKDFCQET